MTWQIVLQSFTAGLAAIGCWFLYDIVRDFKAFKSEANKEIQALKNARESFLLHVRSSEMSMRERVADTKKILNEFKLGVKEDVIDLKSEFREIKEISEKHEDFLRKSLEVSRKFSQEIKSLKIQMGEITILKSGK